MNIQNEVLKDDLFDLDLLLLKGEMKKLETQHQALVLRKVG
jgi:hypothetical protein